MTLKEKYFTIVNKMGSVQRNATNPFAKAKYASLSNVQKHLQPLLEEHKCFISFHFADLENDVYKSNIMLHDVESDEVIGWNFDIPLDNTQNNRVQGFGATTTYGQRYMLCVAFQIALDDTDPDAQQPAKPEAPAKPKAKPALLPGTKKWTNAVEHLRKPGSTINDVLKVYTVTNVNITKLQEEAL